MAYAINSGVVCKYMHLLEWILCVVFDTCPDTYIPEDFDAGDLIFWTGMTIFAVVFVIWWIVPARWIMSRVVFRCKR